MPEQVTEDLAVVTALMLVMSGEHAEKKMVLKLLVGRQDWKMKGQGEGKQGGQMGRTEGKQVGREV